MTTTVTRTMTLDMGHRIPNHDSKCRSLHGHTYKIEAEASASSLVSKKGSSSEGMIVDFSVLKNAMQETVHKIYDHSLTLYWADPTIRVLCMEAEKMLDEEALIPNCRVDAGGYIRENDGNPKSYPQTVIINAPFHTQLNIVSFIPTAENLAAHWFYLIQQKLTTDERCEVGCGFKLVSLTAWETPNCFVRYTE